MSVDRRRLAGLVPALDVAGLAAESGYTVEEVERALADLERVGLIERNGSLVGVYWPSSLR